MQLILSSIFHIDYPTGNIPLSEAERLAQNPLVKYAIPLALGDSHRGFRIVGTNWQYPTLYDMRLAEGRAWEKNFEVCIGSRVAQLLNLRIGDTFFGAHGLSATDGEVHDEHAFTVVGIFEQHSGVIDQLILCNVESVWAAHAHSEDTDEEANEEKPTEVSQQDTQPATHAHTDREIAQDTGRVISSKEAQTRMLQARQKNKDTGLPKGKEDSELTSLLIKFNSPMGVLTFPRYINQQTSLQAASPAYEVSRLFSLIGFGFTMLRAFAYLMVFIAALSIFIALYNALRERQYDLAVMRAMGASKVRLFFLVILESVLLTTFSTLFGITLGHFTLQVVIHFWDTAGQAGLNPWGFLWEEAVLLVVAMLLGFLTALLPAIQAYRTNLAAVLAKG